MSAPTPLPAWDHGHGELIEANRLNRFPNISEMVECLTRQRFTLAGKNEEIDAELKSYAEMILRHVGKNQPIAIVSRLKNYSDPR